MTIATIVGPALASAPSRNERDTRNGGPTRPFLRCLRIAIGAAGLLAALAHPLPAFAAKPALTDVKVFPADVNLKTRGDRQSIVVQAIYADGVTRDVTAQASFTLGNKTLVKFDHFMLTPVADGQTELKVKFQGKTLVVPVKIEAAKVAEPISFIKDVMPVFTKAGCNTGGCHGTSRGKDGFRLSLFGYDPDGDYHRLTREAIARRINLALPEESLILEKATRKVPHTGGELFKSDSEFYRTLLTWLQAGAPKDGPDVTKVVRLEINPRQSVLEGTGEAQQLSVRAFYSDGTDRDVTYLTAFMGNNDAAVKVSASGKATALSRGEAFITARYEGLATGVQVLAIPKNLQFTWPAVAENNYIDTQVNAKLRKLRIAPSDLCDDPTFLRRVYLDITGTLPSPDQVRTFLADTSGGKRDAVIDDLLGRKEFVDLWVMKWAELLQIRSADQQVQMSTKSALQYFDWLEGEITQNVPVDVMVKKLLTATGPSFEEPAANFYKIERDTLKLSENVAQAFMGVRVQCTQCHNHPFDRWTMNDYFGFAAFFAQVGRKAGEDPRETIVFNSGGGAVKHPVTGKDMAPKFLGGAQPEIAKGADRRQVLAEWLTAPENP
ncbi:MAG: cell surface protein, partial [Opitutia bacterium]